VLVVVLDGGASGYLLGNYAASTVVLLGIWWSQRRLLLGASDAPPTPIGPLLRFGLPTVPPEAAVFALQLRRPAVADADDGRRQRGRLRGRGSSWRTLVIVVARAFQAAWPPLAYELGDEEAPRTYAHVVRAYVLLLGWMVAALTLMRLQVAQVLLGDEFSASAVAGALPWLALGWSLWGLTWVFTSIAGRYHATGRTLPAALLGLIVNIAALALLVPTLEATGAAIALVAAYVVALLVAHLRTRRLLHVPFEWARLAAAVGLLTVVAAGGDWLLPADGAAGWTLRIVGCALVPPLLVAVGAVRPAEVRVLWRAVSARLPGR